MTELLNEPLLSQDLANKYTNTILQSLEREIQIKDHYQHELSDFQKQQTISKQLIPPADSDTEEEQIPIFDELERVLISNGNKEERKLESFDYQGTDFLNPSEQNKFFQQSLGKYSIPSTAVVALAVCSNKPNFIATLSKDSTVMTKNEIREYINLTDYKRLDKIRIASYFSILRIFTQIDPQHYDTYKMKFYQLKPLITFHKMSEFDQVYLDLEARIPVRDYDEVVFDKRKGRAFEKQKENEDGEKDLEKFAYGNDEDENFYDSQSEAEEEVKIDDMKITHLFEEELDYNVNGSEPFCYNLFREEEKWAKRAFWLESVLERFKCTHSEVQSWVKWLEAKFEELQDLEIPVHTAEDTRNDEVFYLFDWINNMKNEDQKDVYDKDEQVFPSEEPIYPKYTFMDDKVNDFATPAFSAKFNVREKFCVRLNQIEKDTEYFLQMWKKKNFGMEKKYEKRINARGRDFIQPKLMFDSSGKYINFQFKLREDKDSHQALESDIKIIDKNYKTHIDNCLAAMKQEKQEGGDKAGDSKEKKEYIDYFEEESRINIFNNYQKEKFEDRLEEDVKYFNFSMVFNMTAKYKEPLMLKPDLKIIQFNDKTLTAQRITNDLIYEYNMNDYTFKLIKDKLQVQSKGDHNLNMTIDSIESVKFYPWKLGYQTFTVQKHMQQKADENQKCTTAIVRLFQCQVEDIVEKKGGRKESGLKDIEEQPAQQVVEPDDGAEEGYGEEVPAKPKKVYTAKNQFNFVEYLVDDKIPFDEPSHEFFNKAADPIESQYHCYVTEKGDKCMLIQQKENKSNALFWKMYSNLKDKKFATSQEMSFSANPNILKQIKEFKIQIIPLQSDFLIVFKQARGSIKTFYQFFLNELKIGEIETATDAQTVIKPYFTDKLQKIVVYSSKPYNNISYYYLDYTVDPPKDQLRKFQSIKTKVINETETVCWPYLFIIYNNDQIYMKDLRKSRQRQHQHKQHRHNHQGEKDGDDHPHPEVAHREELEVIYYMNNFLGINTTNYRPLCIFPYIKNSKLQILVPCISTDNSKQDFSLRLHSLQSLSYLTEPFQFNHYAMISVTQFNTDIVGILKDLLHGFTDDKGRLHDDIRIEAKNNAISISKLINNVCVRKLMYVPLAGPNCIRDHRSGEALKDKKFRSPALLIVKELIDAKVYYLNEDTTLQSLKEIDPVLSYADEDGDEIYNVLIDTAMDDLISMYFFNVKGVMTKYTAKYDTECIESQTLTVELDQSNMNVAEAFKTKASKIIKKAAGGEGEDDGEADKSKEKEQQGGKIKLSSTIDMFIANGIFYSQGFFIDLDQFLADKKQQFRKFKHPIHEGFLIQNVTYSQIEGKLIYDTICNKADINKGDRDMHFIFTLPLLNSRKIPLFSLNDFIHPVVPLVNQEIGIVSAFTLSLRVRIQLRTGKYHNNQNAEFYYVVCNSTPGLRIKHFNGIEEELHMSTMGENYTEIIRFNQSKNGKYVVIGGKKDKGDQVFIGLTIYEITATSIQIIQEIPFAKYTGEMEDEIAYLKMKKTNAKIDIEVEGSQYNELPSDASYASWVHFYNKITVGGGAINSSELTTDEITNLYDKDLNLEKTDPDAHQEELRLEQEEIQRHGSVASSPLIKPQGKMYGADEQKFEDSPYKNCSQFANFDLPYIMTRTERFYEIQKQEELIRCKESSPEVFYDYASKIEQDEKQKVLKMHANLHLDVTGHGHLYIINRLNNTLYFFYSPKAGGAIQCKRIKFKQNFVLKVAEISEKYLLLRSQNEFKVYEMSLLNQIFKPSLKEEEIKDCLIYDSKVEEDKIAKSSMFKSKTSEKDALDIKYKYEIIEIKIIGECVLLIAFDINNPDVQYIRHINVVKKSTEHYAEGNNMYISGCKRYIWRVDDGQVMDIEGGFSTFFDWPGNKTFSHFYEANDVFNVTSDDTIFSTHGYLILSYNYISTFIHQQLFVDWKDSKRNKYLATLGHNAYYMYYLLPGNKSVLHEIMNTDTPFSDLTKILQFLSAFIIPGEDDVMQLGMFFLAYKDCARPYNKEYYIDEGEYKEYCEEGCHLNIFERLFIIQNTRFDFIENILQYVVQSGTVNLQNQINRCFIPFLQYANVSPSFQKYMTQSVQQTKQMIDSDKFQFQPNKEGLLIDSYTSPVMDARFNSIFKDSKAAKMDAEIMYINCEDLLCTKGAAAMEILTDSKFLKIMSHPYIQYIVEYQWKKVKADVIKKLFIPYFVLIIFFTLFATEQVNYYGDPWLEVVGNSTATPPTEDVDKDFGDVIFPIILFFLNVTLLSLLLAYFFIIEAKQFKNDVTGYFSSIWNLTDLFSHSLCAIVIFLGVLNLGNQIDIGHVVRPIASICCLQLWLKLFYFLRIFDITSNLIRMIIEICKAISNFLIVFFIAIIGFANGFMILSQVDGDAQAFSGKNFFMSCIYAYRQAFGDLQVDKYTNLNYVDHILAWGLFIMCMLFIVIVLLNLLIAIMGDVFGKTLDQITNLAIREKAMLVSENEVMFDRHEKFDLAQFIIVLKEKSMEQSEFDIEAQVKSLETKVVGDVKQFRTELNVKLDANQKDLKKKFTEQDEKLKTQGRNLESVFGSSIQKTVDQLGSQQAKIDALTQNVGKLEGMLTQLTTQMNKVMVDKLGLEEISKAV